MNKFLVFKDVDLKIGKLHGNRNVPNKIVINDFMYNIKIYVNDKYVDLHNDAYVNIDVTISYGTLEKVLDISKRDLYYLFSSKETVSKQVILDKLLEQKFLETVLLDNVNNI